MRGSVKLNGAAFVMRSITKAVAGNFTLGAHFYMFSHFFILIAF